ncbi:MAG TPA: PEGA domain-containing protein [Patescibacteria group bacterium]|nr:PEGA domain-containing protein [Patescibacteria group bacterium]
MDETPRNNFTPIPNPYIVGNPIEDSRMFFGRVDDFEFIRKKVAGHRTGGIIVLCGSRRSGKTSILFQIKQGRLGEDFVPVLIDMQSITVRNDREFLEALARQIAAALGRTGALVGDDFSKKLAANPLLAFNEFTQKAVDALTGRNLILMFDEYELFESLIDRERFSEDVLNLMAYWMENTEGVYFLFTGSDKLEERDPRYWASFLGKALHRRVSFLRRGDAMRLMQDPVAGLVRYDEGVLDVMFRLTAGQPFYTQVLCQSIVDHLNESEKNTVSPGDVDDVVNEIIENPLPQMIFSWSSLAAMEKISLSIIAELSKERVEPVEPDDIVSFAESERIGYRIDSNKLRETLERLFYQDYLEKDPETERYAFRMDLWRRWMVRMHSIWQVLDEIKEQGSELGEGLVPVRRRRRVAAIALAATAVVITVAALIYSFNMREEVKRRGVVAPRDSTRLTVMTAPPGAQVFLDRTLVGESPVTDIVPAGASALRVTLAGYRDYEDSIRLEKDVPLERTVALVERRGSLAVASTPPGAGIELDGEPTGRETPCTFDDLSVNRLHSVVLKLPGFYAREIGGIEIVADSAVSITHRFSKVVHPLTIISDPGGAEISIDGVSRGAAPLSIRAIEEGRHEIVARLAGYFDNRQAIDVPAPRNQISVVLTLLPPGELVIEILPYAELWIDGELRERDAVNYRIALRPGTHTIELRHPVYGTVRESIELKSEEKITRTFDLERRNRE